MTRADRVRDLWCSDDCRGAFHTLLEKQAFGAEVRQTVRIRLRSPIFCILNLKVPHHCVAERSWPLQHTRRHADRGVVTAVVSSRDVLCALNPALHLEPLIKVKQMHQANLHQSEASTTSPPITEQCARTAAPSDDTPRSDGASRNYPLFHLDSHFSSLCFKSLLEINGVEFSLA